MQLNKCSFYLKRSILCFLPILITSCGGGGITLDATDGSKINFKKENVFCEKGIEYEDFLNLSGGGMRQNVDCTASGVRTFLTGSKSNFFDTKFCQIVDLKGKKQFNAVTQSNQSSFVCTVAKQFGKIK